MARFDAKYARKSYKIALASMMAALSVIALYIGVVVPGIRVTMYFLSSVFVMPMLIEEQPSMALLQFGVVSGISLLIVPNILMVLPYVLLFGHYGIAKYYIERMTNKALAYVIKLIYFDIFMVLIYIICGSVFFTGMFENMALWLIALLMQVFFLVFDYLFSKVTVYYVKNIRERLLRQGNGM